MPTLEPLSRKPPAGKAANRPPASQPVPPAVGNQGMQHLLAGTQAGTSAQPRLGVGASHDPLEHEADRMADRALSGQKPRAAQQAPAGVQRHASQPRDAAPAPESVERTLAGAGSPLAPRQREDMERRFGADFSGVRVHTDPSAQQSAQQLGARAYTSGSHIVFGSGQYAPGTPRGQRLMAHELSHVVQQTGAGHAGPSKGARTPTRGGLVQRAIVPEDVAVEMISKTFELADSVTFGAFVAAKGAQVTITSWTNASSTVTAVAPVSFSGTATVANIIIPKVLLRPVAPSGATLDPYSTGIAGQAKAVLKNEADLVGKTGAEKTRLEGLLQTRRDVLNRKLIQETMYNRFDPIIQREVAAANATAGLTGKAALDPNLLKAMIFQESEMGTAGTHMSVPPTHMVKTRFNLGQVIDSSALALLTMMEREQPTWVAAFFLGSLRSDLSAAQKRKKKLEGQATLSASESAELAELKRQSGRSWETFIWEYVAPGKTVGFEDAVRGFFASTAPAKNMDYEFWIHMMVLWLFEKKTASRSWPDTIKAYNGSGKRADHYRDAVVQRAADAKSAAASGTAFKPTR